MYSLPRIGPVPGQCPNCFAEPALEYWRGLKIEREDGHHGVQECATVGCGNRVCDRCALELRDGLRCNECVAKAVAELVADGDVLIKPVRGWDDEDPDNLLPDPEPTGWMTDESCPF